MYFQIVIFLPQRGRIIIVNKDETGVSENINFYTIVVVSSFLMKNVTNNAIDLLAKFYICLWKYDKFRAVLTMKRKIKLLIAMTLCTFLVISTLNVYGVDTKNDEELQSKISGINGKQYIEIPGTTILITLWDEQLENGTIVPYYSISIAGKIVRTVQPSYELGLRYAHFDPLIDVPQVDSRLSADFDTHLYIVQFLTQPLEEFQNAITALGGNVRHYIAQFAYLVEMSDDVKIEVEQLPYVRWIGAYHPAYRLEEFMLDNIDTKYTSYPFQRYNIQVLDVSQKQTVSDLITSQGWELNSANAGKFLIEATLTPDQLFEVVRWNEVLFVDRWSPYEVDMDIAREIGGANYIETVGGYTGAGVRGESFDTGFNLNHVDFAAHPLIEHGGTVPNDSHGTACIGICFGDGTGNPQARGLLPDGQGIVAYYNNIGLTGPDRYTHTGELVQEPYNAVFQTSSVGSDRTTQYTTISADTDTSLFDFDIVHCQSQSNSGWEDSRPQAWAKNIISGGGVYHYDTLDKSDDMWNSGASTGPATDGRVKPTLTFFYDDIFTTSSSGPTSYTSTFGGTSGATPIIAGHVGLFFQMWSEGIFGNPVDPEGTVFENKAHMTTAKAMLVATASQYDFTGTSHDKTRMHQGWGMPDLAKLFDMREKMFIIDETDILAPFEVSEHTIAVASGESELKIAMTYADPAGNPAVQTQHRINDLTLKVTSPSGTYYYGNCGLLTGVWSEPDGMADTKNTVECVFIENPEAGAWTVEISADEIIQDSHIETPCLDADYALVVVGGIGTFLEPPIGPTQGEAGVEYSFTMAIPENLEEDDIYVMWDWGDNSSSDWVGPYSPGETAPAAHTWTRSGMFEIKVKVRDDYGYESTWTDPLVITIIAPEFMIESISSELGKIKVTLKNIGELDALNINWNIKLDGGFIILGAEKSGSLLGIPAGGSATISSDFILGLGNTNILVTAELEEIEESDELQQEAFVFLFFIKLG